MSKIPGLSNRVTSMLKSVSNMNNIISKFNKIMVREYKYLDDVTSNLNGLFIDEGSQ